MKTLKQLREDPRICEILVQNTEECDHKYLVNLKDGYIFTFDGYSGLTFCDTVAEINEIMSDIEEDVNNELV